MRLSVMMGLVWIGMLWATTGALYAQGLSNASLTGKYLLRQVFTVSNGSGVIGEARSLSATATFDGLGGFSLIGQQAAGTSALTPLSGSGTYSLGASGILTLTNPLRTGTTMNGRFADAALLASSTETGAGVFDMLVAVPAHTSALAATLNGNWRVAGVDFRNGNPALTRAAFFSLTATDGNFATAQITGQAANLGTRPVTQQVSGATYTMTADGSGTANFPLAGGFTANQQLVSGGKTLYLSRDGNFFLMGSTEAGGHDFLIGMMPVAGTASNASWKDLYWSAGIKLDSGRMNAHAGSGNATGSGALFMSRRVRGLDGVTDFTGINRYTVQADGTGRVELNSLAIGAGGNSFLSSGVALADSNNYELVFGVRAPPVATGTGVFLHPYGAVNAASFAPAGNPVSPGAFITLFGSNLAASTVTASSLPFPTVLAGVQVLVNNRPAPVYLVAAGQISFLIPNATETTGNATIVVVGNGTRSNEIQAPVSRTSPGVFSVPPAGFGPGAILKTNFTLVSAANPARRGETVQVFLTGLGAAAPAVPDGAAAGANPLSLVTAAVNVYVGGESAQVTFKGLSPGLAGLYQLNIVIPPTAPSGANVPLGIETPDAFHDQVDIAITP
ncbi:MAG: IPT/TIG domain-containing protein [Acidobacteriia bacterium]|nr:IPT/TIG domain-containing protein [Terriglobia bacterium]